MDDQRFHETFGERLAGLRAHRGACPEPELLLALVEQTVDDRQLAELGSHVALCPRCARAVELIESEPAIDALGDTGDELDWRRSASRLDRRAQPWRQRPPVARPLLVMAASVLVALGAAWWWLAAGPGDEHVATVRGSEIQLERPLRVAPPPDRPLVFEWSTVLPLDLDYRLEVEHEGETLWIATATGEGWYAPTPEQRDLLAPGRTYRWRVTGIEPGGGAVLVSDWADLTMPPIP